MWFLFVTLNYSKEMRMQRHKREIALPVFQENFDSLVLGKMVLCGLYY